MKYKQRAQPVKLQKKQCGRVYFCVHGTAFSMPIQQKLPPLVLLFSDFAGWVKMKTYRGQFSADRNGFFCFFINYSFTWISLSFRKNKGICSVSFRPVGNFPEWVSTLKQQQISLKGKQNILLRSIKMSKLSRESICCSLEIKATGYI